MTVLCVCACMRACVSLSTSACAFKSLSVTVTVCRMSDSAHDLNDLNHSSQQYLLKGDINTLPKATELIVSPCLSPNTPTGIAER